MLTRAALLQSAAWRTVRREARTPKGLLLAMLVGLTVIGLVSEGIDRAWPMVVAAVVAATATDLLAARLNRGHWPVPTAAMLTGLIVAHVLDSHESWPVAALTAVLAILIKHLLRDRVANVFNPAGAALLAGALLANSGHGWWAGLPNLPLWALPLVVVPGIYIANRVDKLPLVLAFAAMFIGLFAASAYLGDPGRVAEIFRSPSVNATFYFALIMLTDPPTAPIEYRDQVQYGLLVAIVAAVVFLGWGAVYYLLAGLVVGNGWTAWRRFERREQRRGDGAA